MARTARVVLAAVALAGVASASASASTFFVSTTGNNGNDCTSAATGCLTINGAIAKARAAQDTATINVGAGTFTEDVALDQAADDGTSIVGAGSGAGGTTIQGVNGNPAVKTGFQSTGNDVSHLKILGSPGGGDSVVQASSPMTLTDVAMTMHAGASQAVQSNGLGLVLDGDTLTMESGSSGAAINVSIGDLTIRGATVTLANGATGTAIRGGLGPMTVANSTGNVGNTGSRGIDTDLAPSTISDTTVNQGATGAGANGIVSAYASLTLTNVTVTMSNPGNTSIAVMAQQNTAVLDHLTVTGSWSGVAVEGSGSTTLRDSHLTTPAASTQAVGEFLDGGSAGRSALVQRSVLRQMSNTPAGIIALDTNLTVDSSEVLGGQIGIQSFHSGGKLRTTTIAGSTVDAGVLGSRDAPPVSAVEGLVGGSNNSTLNIYVQGSILVDSQTATLGGSNTLTIICSNTDQPDQTQAADA